MCFSGANALNFYLAGANQYDLADSHDDMLVVLAFLPPYLLIGECPNPRYCVGGFLG